MSTQQAVAVPPSPQVSSHPANAIVVEHQEEGSRLVFLNLEKKERRSLQPFGPEVRWPAFTPDGTHVLYSSGSELHLLAIDQDKDALLVEGMYTENTTPYAFSPDGKSFSVLTNSDVRVIDASELASKNKMRRTLLPKDCKFIDMLWSLSSNSVLVLCYPSPTTGDYELVRVERSTGQSQTKPAPGIKRLLGWRDSASLLAVKDRNGFDDPGVMGVSGSFDPLRPHESDTAETFVQAYIQAVQQLVFAKPAEDNGDPTRLLLAPAGPGPAKRWLSAFPRLGDLRFSADGKYAVFADRARFAGNTPEQGGDVYIVQTGQEDAHILLRGTPEKISYSSPVLRP